MTNVAVGFSVAQAFTPGNRARIGEVLARFSGLTESMALATLRY